VLVDFLRANADVFAWSPSDMPGIPRDVAKHSLDIRAGARPVRQPLRRFDGEKRRVIGEETHKLKEAKGAELSPERLVLGASRGTVLGFIVSERGIEANQEKTPTITRHPEPLLGVPGGYTHPRERPPVITDILEPGTYELAGGQGEVYDKRLERPTATSLLPSRCFQAIRIPRSHTSISRQGRVGLASAEPDPPSGAKKGEPLCVEIGCTSPHQKISIKKGVFAFSRLCQKQGPEERTWVHVSGEAD
jgi:hypothetical protein